MSATRRPTSRPARCKARFNTRFNDLWTSKTLLAHLKERIERASAALGGNGTIEFASVEVSGESFYTAPGPLVELVAGAIRDVAGIEPELSTTGGTSDARFIRRYCPVLEFGLVGETMHKVDEKSADRRPQDPEPRLRDGARPLFRGLGPIVLSAAEIARGMQGALGFLRRDPAALLSFRQHDGSLPALVPPHGGDRAVLRRLFADPLRQSHRRPSTQASSSPSRR